MAAKTLTEAIESGIIGVSLCDIEAKLKGELRDYIAHRIMILQGHRDEPLTAQELFDEMFVDVSPFKGVKEKAVVTSVTIPPKK